MLSVGIKDGINEIVRDDEGNCDGLSLLLVGIEDGTNDTVDDEGDFEGHSWQKLEVSLLWGLLETDMQCM